MCGDVFRAEGELFGADSVPEGGTGGGREERQEKKVRERRRRRAAGHGGRRGRGMGGRGGSLRACFCGVSVLNRTEGKGAEEAKRQEKGRRVRGLDVG